MLPIKPHHTQKHHTQHGPPRYLPILSFIHGPKMGYSSRQTATRASDRSATDAATPPPETPHTSTPPPPCAAIAAAYPSPSTATSSPPSANIAKPPAPSSPPSAPPPHPASVHSRITSGNVKHHKRNHPRMTTALNQQPRRTGPIRQHSDTPPIHHHKHRQSAFQYPKRLLLRIPLHSRVPLIRLALLSHLPAPLSTSIRTSNSLLHHGQPRKAHFHKRICARSSRLTR